MGAREVDARTDIYSLGCVLYEMLAGEPPFVGPTAQSIVAKVITESPKSLTAQRRTVPPHVDAAVQKSLEKLAADRFASAGAFAESLRDSGASLRTSDNRSTHARTSSRPASGNVLKWGVAALGAVAIIAAGYVAGRRSSSHSAVNGVSMEQKTYRTQTIFSARYVASGEMVFSAADGGNSPAIYTLTSAYPQPRSVSEPATHLLSVSSKNEMAVLVSAVYSHHRMFTGTLARMPVSGGTPRELLTSVHDADWSPDGSQLAVVHEVNGKDRLEFPIGTVLYETNGYVSDVRMSADGQRVAFTEHPEKGDDRGMVAVVDLKGDHKVLTPQYLAIEGLAWSTHDNNLVYSSATSGGILTVNEVTLRGEIHPGTPGVGNAIIQDIASDGRRLIIRDDYFKRIWVKRAADPTQQDVSWLDVSFFPILSADGSLLAFGDGSDVAGEHYATMLRRTDGSPAVRLGEGAVLGMSRDKQWVMSVLPTAPVQLMLYPTGAGSSRRLDKGEFVAITAAAFAGGSDIMICGNEPGHSSRCYVKPLANGTFKPFTPEGVRGVVASGDGQFIVAMTQNGYTQFAIQGGTSQSVPGITLDDQVIRYSPDGKSLWIRRKNSQPVHVEQLDIKTGARRALLPDFSPRRAGVLSVSEVALADDPRSYAYMERESTSYLFEMKGMR
jgi:eukaryotic-like serine/threonine-protein kinase